jgi:hypothetical protein
MDLRGADGAVTDLVLDRDFEDCIANEGRAINFLLD